MLESLYPYADKLRFPEDVEEKFRDDYHAKTVLRNRLALDRQKIRGASNVTESILAKKMKLKPGARAAILNAPENYLEELKHDSEISQKLSGTFDWIQIFVRDKAELDTLAPKAAKALKPDSILWISFPKGSSKSQTDLTRDKGWENVQALSLKWINLISVDETWSAFSLRPYKEGEKKQSFR